MLNTLTLPKPIKLNSLAYGSFICLLLVLSINGCGPVGPGRGIYRRMRYNVIDTQPPRTNEHSLTASGRGKRLNRTDPRLSPIITTSIVFQDPRFESPNRLSTRVCRINLLKLADLVENYWGKKYKIKVLRGYLEEPVAGKKPNSLHLQGRAFDLTLTPYNKYVAHTVNEAEKLQHLRNLAGLAFYKAKFSYVKVYSRSNKHIHVSCPTTQKGNGRRSKRCFPASSFVRLENGNKKYMKDLQIGDKVLTLDSDGNLIYSEISMIMHRQDVIVSNYVTIRTKSNHKLHLSPYHLVLTAEGQSMFAKDVRLNEMLFVYNHEHKLFQKYPVVDVQYDTVEFGAYAPLTMKGTVVVNDVYVSCYAVFPSHYISHAAFSLWRILYSSATSYIKSIIATNSAEYHWYPSILRSITNKFISFPYQL